MSKKSCRENFAAKAGGHRGFQFEKGPIDDLLNALFIREGRKGSSIEALNGNPPNAIGTFLPKHAIVGPGVSGAEFGA